MNTLTNHHPYTHYTHIPHTKHTVPDIHIEGTLEAIHVMLDKPQLELVKGLIDMNLGEGIEEFEKPSTVIRDPIAQVSVFCVCYVCMCMCVCVCVHVCVLLSSSPLTPYSPPPPLILSLLLPLTLPLLLFTACGGRGVDRGPIPNGICWSTARVPPVSRDRSYSWFPDTFPGKVQHPAVRVLI